MRDRQLMEIGICGYDCKLIGAGEFPNSAVWRLK